MLYHAKTAPKVYFSTTLLVVLSLTGARCLADPVHDAARKGDVAKLKDLIASNPSVVSSQDKMGKTPLHLAAEHNQMDAAVFLIDHGADVNAKDKNGGFTPIDLALSSYHYMDMIRLLIDHGANVNTASSQGVTPLDEAAMRGQKDAVDLLLSKGADPNARDEKGDTPLIWSLLMGHTDAAISLINGGADVNVQNTGGASPLKLAKLRNNRKLENLLVSKGARE